MPAGARPQHERMTTGREAGAPRQAQTSQALAMAWRVVNVENAWDAASTVRTEDITEVESLASSFRTATAAPRQQPPAGARGPEEPPAACPALGHAVDATSAASGQCAAMGALTVRALVPMPATAPTGAGGPELAAAAADTAPVGVQLQGPACPAAEVDAGDDGAKWQAAAQAWAERAAEVAQARAGPSTSTASSSNAWTGAELWCEKKAGDLFCLLCNKFASEAHLQCKMHLSRLQDPGSWLEWQRAEAEAQQRRA